MRVALPLLLACLLCCGCASRSVRGIEETPENPADYSAVYFSSPNTDRVVVTSVTEHSALLGDRGFGINPAFGIPMPEPLWLWPGWVHVTYACPSAPQSFYKGTVGLSKTGKYFLHCGVSGKLLATRVEP